MNLLIDIHCHLHYYSPKDLNNIIENAKKVGLACILTNGIDPKTNRVTLSIAEKYDIVKAALGIYPINRITKKANFDGSEAYKEIGWIEKNKDCIIAIGECGLDGLNKDNFCEQKKIFEELIALSERIKKPLIVHSRKAEASVLDMLESSNVKRVLLHCFCGKKSLVKKALDLGFYFSIPTNIVRAQNFKMISDIVDINHLFCETDSPYLSPFRNLKNQPAFVIESYKKIAEIKSMELNEVINNIWMNFKKLFW